MPQKLRTEKDTEGTVTRMYFILLLLLFYSPFKVKLLSLDVNVNASSNHQASSINIIDKHYHELESFL